jgi:hypothetical protein
MTPSGSGSRDALGNEVWCRLRFFFTPSQDSLFSGDQLGRAYWREARFKWVAKMSRLGLGAEEGAIGRLLGWDL